jgi:predicted nucleic acid-binding protein
LIYCLDTDILIEYFRGSEAIKRKIESLTGDDSLGVIWLTFYEFFKGIFVSGKLGEEKFLQELNETCLILNPSYEAAGLVARFMLR